MQANYSKIKFHIVLATIQHLENQKVQCNLSKRETDTPLPSNLKLSAFIT